MKATATPGIYSRGNSYVVRVYDAAAKRYAVNKTFASYREAQTALTDFKAAKNAGRGVKATNHTVASLWVVYRPHVEETRRENTATAYRSHFSSHIVPKLGTVKLRDLDGPRVQRFIDELHRKKLSPSTIHAIRSALSGMLIWARKRGYVSFNACQGLELPALSGETSEGRSLTRDECDKLIAATSGQWKLAVELGLRTGLRSGELRGILWSAVDISGGLLNVREQLLRSGNRGQTKSRRGVREIPLTAELQKQLAKAKLASEHSGDEDYVFTSVDGKPRSHDSFYRAVTSAANRAKLGDVTPHDLRHTCASQMVAAGVPVTTVARLIGDKVETVMRVYVRDSGDSVYTEQAREALAAAF